MSPFIRRYAKYLNEKALSYRTVAFDFCKVKRGFVFFDKYFHNITIEIYYTYFFPFQKRRRLTSYNERWKASQNSSSTSGSVGFAFRIRLHSKRPNKRCNQHVLYTFVPRFDQAICLLQRRYYQFAWKIFWYEQKTVSRRTGSL